MDAFLTIITPTYRRPKGLAACLASVEKQTYVASIQHMVIVDHAGYGIQGMYRSLRDYKSAVKGRYVHVLCDDDVLAGESVVEDVANFAKQHDYPPVILVGSEKDGIVYPLGNPWPPVIGHIDLGCLIVRSDVWRDHCDWFDDSYEGDYWFSRALHRDGVSALSCPVLFQRGAYHKGAPEAPPNYVMYK